MSLASGQGDPVRGFAIENWGYLGPRYLNDSQHCQTSSARTTSRRLGLGIPVLSFALLNGSFRVLYTECSSISGVDSINVEFCFRLIEDQVLDVLEKMPEVLIRLRSG
jgi:hypothetical protein